MRAEVSANSVLPAHLHLPRPQLERIVELGWRSPTDSLDASTPPQDPDGSPNFFVDLPVPVDHGRLATLVLDTFVDAVKVPYPGGLTYKAWGHDGLIELPALKLTHEDRPPVPYPEAVPETLESVRSKLEQIVRILRRDNTASEEADGTLTLRVGSADVRVKVMDDLPGITLSTPILSSVQDRNEAVKVLNQINAVLRFMRVVLIDDTVVAIEDVHADPFDWPTVARAIGTLLRFTDNIDEQLQQKLGGTWTSAQRRRPPQDPPPAGFL